MTGNTHPGLRGGASNGGIGLAGNDAGPDDLDDLQRLLQTLRGPAQPTELARLTVMSAAMQSAVHGAMHAMGDAIGDTTGTTVTADAGSPVPSHPKEPKRMLAKLITLKAAGIIGAGVLTVGTAAAATGGWAGPRPPAHSNASSTARDRIAAMTADTGAEEAAEETTTSTETSVSVPDSTTQPTETALPVVESDVEEAEEADEDCQVAGEEAHNHGEFVSSVAKNREADTKAGGARNHGEAVSEAAHSDCGKPGQDDSDSDSDSETTTATTESEEEPEQDETDSDSGNGSGKSGNSSGKGKNPNK